MNIDPPKQLTVLSLNCWGLYVVSKKRRFRLEAIADYISQEDYDLVALQEVWMPSDVELILERAQNLPYSKHFYSGALGSGLVLLSRFPILSSSYLQFSLAGRPLKVLQGDFYVGKGLGSICIDHPDIGLVDVYNTHLQASYGQKDDYEAQRITECWQITQAVRNSAALGRHVIMAGDFNSIPTSHCYQLLKQHGFMTDSWLETHQETLEESQVRLEEGQLSISECIQHFGITCDSPVNTWTKHLLKQQPHAKDIGDRLDYVFYRRSPQVQCLESSVVLHEYIPNTDMSFSDHFGVRSVFTISTEATSALDSHYAPTSIELARPKITQLTEQQLKPILKLISQELVKARATMHAYLFGFSLLVLLTFLSWLGQIVLVNRLLNGLLGLVTIGSAAGAMVCLIVGFVFGRTEERLLLEYQQDILLLRSNG